MAKVMTAAVRSIDWRNILQGAKGGSTASSKTISTGWTAPFLLASGLLARELLIPIGTPSFRSDRCASKLYGQHLRNLNHIGA